MTDLLQQNMAIIRRRWPEVAQAMDAADPDSLDAMLVTGAEQTISVNGIQLSSRHNRLSEVELLAAQLPETTPSIFLYGLGMGDLPRELLARPALKNLILIPLNMALLKLLLSYTEQQDWLIDPRCELILPSNQSQFREPAIALIADMVLAEDSAAELRNKWLVKNQLQFSARDHRPDDKEILQRFTDNGELIRSEPDVSLLFNKTQGERLIIACPGPSLSDCLPGLLLAQQSATPYKIIALDTAFKALFEHGIRPDIVVSIDAAIDRNHLHIEASNDISLVYFPRLANEVIRAWKGPRYMAYSASSLYDIPRQIKMHSSLYAGGSVLHPAVDLAVKMGASDIILLGCDLAFPGNRTHTGWEDGELNMHIGAQGQHQWLVSNAGDKVITSLSFMSYLDALQDYIQARPAKRFYTTSLNGAAIQGCGYLAPETLWPKKEQV
ncbi:motility associated factor glycosyltransferase family protein [Shewanella cyperi]|uniref:motility associated factor glycosyltransferase family protein n=1 Tax=Shewanella cyperi TaxID=2814292 RepID=UPI001A94BCD2|nr:6-hydroxymethylpterin diphosphokinase MptE-like protein [Shewanella cyperi]QSX39717.1 motility associated factor glycosyltransferase family protein [Shewanella cyperi]